MKGLWIGAVVASCLGTAAGQTWTPELSMKVQGVGAVTPSPDGRLVVYTQTRALMDGEKSEHLTQIFLARADGSQRTQLTRGERSATAPSFSPDGRQVYFLSARSESANVWRIAVEGGEGERVTDWKGSLGSYAVSPDGKWLAFAGAEPSAESARAVREKVDFRVIGENLRNHALWIVAAEPGATPKRLAGGSVHVGDFAWSPDSRAIAFAHMPTAEIESGRLSDVSEVLVENGAVSVVAATGATESGPRYSPDGRYVAYVQSADPPRSPGESWIALYQRQERKSRVLAASFDRLPNPIGWSGDSRRVLFSEGKGTRLVLYALPIDGPPVIVYEPKGTLAAGSANATGTHVGFTGESSNEPPEAFVFALDGRAPVRVSRANDALTGVALGETKVVRWRAADGLEIAGLLTYPPGFVSGRKYPLVLAIHGGPFGVFGENFTGRFGSVPVAAMAAREWLVLRPNPRGSTGYGKEFRFTQLNDRGGKDYLDLMAGVDHVVGLGIADPNRLAVMGYSYGGYMTGWIVTHEKRFKAAIVGAGANNLWSQTGTTDILGSLPDQLGGPSWENITLYLERSPLFHVKNAVTPTLILHGGADARVPPTQGHEFYNALQRRGVTSKMIVYPRMQHGFSEPKFQLDLMQREIEWLGKYLN